jgi:RNA polymerase sigma-70 factor (ECF subfamily)
VRPSQALQQESNASDAVLFVHRLLCVLTGSVVVAINSAVARAAVERAAGAAEGLAALDALKDDAQLAAYQPFGRRAQRCSPGPATRKPPRRAIGLESDPAVRRFLQAELSRTGACAIGSSQQATRG